MNAATTSILAQLSDVRKELAEKRDRLSADLAKMGHDPRRLSAEKRHLLSTTALSLRILDDVESQIFADALDDVPGAIAQLIALLKQVQKAALPGNATPVHGSQVVPPRRPKHA